MEYCSGGDLAIKILKKTKENEKFTEDVWLLWFDCLNTIW
jgi:hypothetical protein